MCINAIFNNCRLEYSSPRKRPYKQRRKRKRNQRDSATDGNINIILCCHSNVSIIQEYSVKKTRKTISMYDYIVLHY